MLSEKMQKALELARSTKEVRSQKEFALSVGMSADRLRNIVNGKIQKLQPEEAAVIQRIYNIRSAWWFSEMAPMLLSDQEQVLQPVFDDLSNATAEVLSLGLNQDRATLVQEILFFVRTKNTKALNQQLDKILNPQQKDHTIDIDQEHLKSWHRCSDDDKKLLLLLLKRFSRSSIQESGAYEQQESNPAFVLHEPGPKG
jgi:hypothetical protein